MKGELLTVVLFALFILAWNPHFSYDNNIVIDAGYVLDSAGISRQKYTSDLAKELDLTKDPWAKADTYLTLARLENNTEYYKLACDNYKRVSPNSVEEKAILYETLASINCRGTRIHDYMQAVHYWKVLGVDWRADLLEKIAYNQTKAMVFEIEEIKPSLNLSGAEKIIIGKTRVEIDKNAVVMTQTDRVFRDWLGVQLQQSPFRGEILKVFSERLKYSEEELKEPVGWHEGGRLRDIIKNIKITHVPAVGTLIANLNDTWYAPNENGIFMFEVPLDKVSYPTTRFFADDLAMIVDSHGMNMLVEQAVRNNAGVVIACCDNPGKIKAVKYLSDMGVSAICFTDLELYLALGLDTIAVGSAPFEFKNGKMVYGGRPLEIGEHQKIVVSDADIGNTYGIWYYQAPKLYFSKINKTFPLDLHIVAVDDFNQTKRVFNKAREINASIVGIRIYEGDDYKQAKNWLEESSEHKLVLFHSLSYPYGLLISQEFKKQVSFGDPNVAKK